MTSVVFFRCSISLSPSSGVAARERIFSTTPGSQGTIEPSNLKVRYEWPSMVVRFRRFCKERLLGEDHLQVRLKMVQLLLCQGLVFDLATDDQFGELDEIDAG